MLGNIRGSLSWPRHLLDGRSMPAGRDAVSFEFLEIAVQAGMAVYTVNRLMQMQV